QLLTEYDSGDAGADLGQAGAQRLDFLGQQGPRFARLRDGIGHRHRDVLQSGRLPELWIRALEAAPPPWHAAMKMGTRPGVDQQKLERQLIDCGDLNMRIARDGTWFYHGSPIGRKPLVKLFASVLRREEDGRYWLVTPVERGLIEVEDAPFTAVELAVEGQGRKQVLCFRTNLDEWVRAGSEHPIRCEPPTGPAAGPRPYLRV